MSVCKLKGISAEQRRLLDCLASGASSSTSVSVDGVASDGGISAAGGCNCEGLSERVDTVLAQMSEVSQKQALSDQRLDTLSEKDVALEGRIESLEQRNSDTEYESLRSSVDDLKQQLGSVSELGVKLSKLEQDAVLSSAKLEEGSQSIASMQERFQEMSSKVEEMKALLESQAQEIARLKSSSSSSSDGDGDNSWE